MKKDNDTITISLRIAGQGLTMHVRPDEEPSLRTAASEVNKVWDQWKRRFEGRDTEEILAMVTILFARAYVDLRSENARMQASLADFDNILTDLLSETE